MRTNADVTIYNQYINTATTPPSAAYQATQISAVAWENRKAANTIATGGRIKADAATIYIPIMRGENYKPPREWQALTSKTGYWTIQEGDIIVRGKVDDILSASFTPSDLKRLYDDVLTISSVDQYDNGTKPLQHWKVSAA